MGCWRASVRPRLVFGKIAPRASAVPASARGIYGADASCPSEVGRNHSRQISS